MKRSAEVRVIGLVSGTHVIEDLGVDVPYGMMVTIAPDQALTSKDLWRGISQRCLLQLPTAPAPTLAYMTQGSGTVDPEKARLERRIAELEARNRVLEIENEALRGQVSSGRNTPVELEMPAEYQAKLDRILSSLENASWVGTTGHHPSARPKPEVADGAAPTFLPSQITPKDVEARIDVQSQESASGAVSDAAGKLRKMRQAKKDE